VPARALKFGEMLARRFRVNLFDKLVYGDEEDVMQPPPRPRGKAEAEVEAEAAPPG